MRSIIFALCLALTVSAAPAATIFSQNFNSSTNVPDYVSATPNSGQFNAIGVSNATNLSVAITSGALAFTKTADPGTGAYSRTTDFTPTPDGMIYSFDFSVSGNSASQTTAAVFQVGSGFVTANSAESTLTNIYARIGINLGSNPGEFQLRNISTTTNSATFSGTQTITWVLNNTGGSLGYTPPGGGSSTVANDLADVYVGTTLVFDDIAVLTGTQVMTDLKFAVSAGFATFSIDNINIESVPEPTAIAFAGLLLLALPRRRRAV